jgi:hypothetical protein
MYVYIHTYIYICISYVYISDILNIDNGYHLFFRVGKNVPKLNWHHSTTNHFNCGTDTTWSNSACVLPHFKIKPPENPGDATHWGLMKIGYSPNYGDVLLSGKMTTIHRNLECPIFWELRVTNSQQWRYDQKYWRLNPSVGMLSVSIKLCLFGK